MLSMHEKKLESVRARFRFAKMLMNSFSQFLSRFSTNFSYFRFAALRLLPMSVRRTEFCSLRAGSSENGDRSIIAVIWASRRASPESSPFPAQLHLPALVETDQTRSSGWPECPAVRSRHLQLRCPRFVRFLEVSGSSAPV